MMVSKSLYSYVIRTYTYIFSVYPEDCCSTTFFTLSQNTVRNVVMFVDFVYYHCVRVLFTSSFTIYSSSSTTLPRFSCDCGLRQLIRPLPYVLLRCRQSLKSLSLSSSFYSYVVIFFFFLRVRPWLGYLWVLLVFIWWLRLRRRPRTTSSSLSPYNIHVHMAGAAAPTPALIIKYFCVGVAAPT